MKNSEQGPANLEALLDLFDGVGSFVAFTGAGISTESGIPDYRGPNGLWRSGAPPTLGDFLKNEETRKAYWMKRKVQFPELHARLPNKGHFALAHMYSAGLLSMVITQNIDGLHRKSGLPAEALIELHGNALDVQCVECGTIYPGLEIHQRQVIGKSVPDCKRCGGLLRATTVLFGQPLPDGALERSLDLARETELMLVVGSSLIVQPAAKVPLVARRSGAKLAIVNLEETPLDSLANVMVPAKAGEVLTQLANFLRNNQRANSSSSETM